MKLGSTAEPIPEPESADLGGKKSEEIRLLVLEEINSINNDGIIFKYANKQAVIYPLASTATADGAYNIIDFDIDQTVDRIINFGRDQNFIIDLKNRLAGLIFNKSIDAAYTLNESEIKKELLANFSQLENPGKDAALNYDSKNSSFFISPEKSGKGFDYEKSIKQLDFNLSRLDNSAIQLNLVEQLPQLRQTDIANADLFAKEYLNLAPLVLKDGKDVWNIEKEELGHWLALVPDRDASLAGGKAKIALNRSYVEKYLFDQVATKTDQKLIDARFQITDGRVTQFQAGKEGRALDIQANLSNIEEQFIGNKKKDIDLIIKKIEPTNDIDDVNALGIKEIIGTGESAFTGSPKNRVKNISVGAASLNGIIVKPGENFSLLKTLGKIDASNGYLQELVIKEGKTIPEYGGGLCQIGTTIFRAAVNSGLPIVERRNHSYRVSYYEPAGTDATIYDPAPDFKFKNDTGNNILIQTRIEGTKLFFDIWGTKDGRVAENTKPTIYNIVKPKPTKLIETTDLPVGKKRCTESAHNGADAFFDYKVTYPDGTIKKERFSSHYVPWQEVCLIGVEKISTPENSNNATSTVSTSSAITTTETAASSTVQQN